MRVLVTGALGFVGRHLAAELRGAGHEVVPLDVPGREVPGGFATDLCDAPALAAAVRESVADACIHLAGLAFVPLSWSEPARVFEVNLGGTVNLLEAFRAARPQARVLLVSTSQVYGFARRGRPLTEDDAPAPETPYAVAKLAAEMTGLLYASRYGMPVLTVRPCNHTGPGQSPSFAVPSFARQVAAIRDGQAGPGVRVGNLESRREFLDVRDVARGYRLLLERGRPGQAYNLASDGLVRMREIFDQLCRIAGVTPRLEVDPALHRPTDEPPLLSTAKLRADTGWSPQIGLDQSLRDILADASAQRPDSLGGPRPQAKSEIRISKQTE